MVQASDDAIWKLAEETGAILITKDEDFATRGKRWLRSVAVIWIRLGNTSRKGLLE
jgi:predicted nuclease of predicted toxin-antitoxin system